MEDLRVLLDQLEEKPDDITILHKLKQNAANLRIVDVMEALTALMASAETKNRIMGYEILLNYLSDSGEITTEEAGVICSFLSQRLKDETLAASLIVKLIRQTFLKQNVPLKVAANIFVNLTTCLQVQQLPPQDRYNVYQLVNALTDSKGNIDYLRKEVQDFVILFSQVGDGERDPRCLLLLFRIFSRVISSIPDLSHSSEEVFDSVSCYFPVSYIPPKDDPYAISREDLAKALSPCLGCHKQFGHYYFQLISEKLSSDREVAKIDSYESLSVCLENLSSGHVKPYMSILWTYIRSDALSSTNHPNLKNSATQVVPHIINSLKDDEEAVDSILLDISSDLQPFLTKRDLGLRQEAASLLLSSLTSAKVLKTLLQAINLHLFASVACSTNQEDAMFVTDLFLRIIKKSKHMASPVDRFPGLDKMLSLVLDSNDQDEDLLIKQLDLLTNIILLPIVLTDDDYERINTFMMDQLKKQPSTQVLKCLGSSMNALISTEKFIIGHDLKIFFREPSKLSRLSNILECLNMPDEWSKDILLHLKELLFVENETESVKHILRALSVVLSKKTTQYDEEILMNLFSVLPDIFKRHNFGLSAAYFIAQRLPLERLRNLVDQNILETKNRLSLYWAVVEGSAMVTLEWNSMFDALNFGDDIHQLLLESLCRYGTDDLVNRIIERIKQKGSSQAIQILKCVTRGLCYRNHRELTTCLGRIYEYFNIPFLEKEASEALLFLHEDVPSPLDNEGLSHLQTKTVSPFYHQKLFFLTLPSLMNRLEETNKETSDQDRESLERRKNSLKQSIIGQLQFLPKCVVKSDVKKIQALVITSLSDMNDPKTVQVSLNCLLHLLENKSCESVVSANINHIVTCLVKNARADSLITRQTSLKCLALLTKLLPENILLSQRPFVVKELQTCLDDKKRLVRRSAADARHSWILVGQAGNQSNE